MMKNEVNVGGEYMAKVSGSHVKVRVTSVSPHGGWDGVNTATGRAIHFRSAMRLSPLPVAKVPGSARTLGDVVKEAVAAGDAAALGRVADRLRARGMTFGQVFDLVQKCCPGVTLAQWDGWMGEADDIEAAS
jgi:hypothetical protein